MNTAARLALVAQLDAQLVKRLDRLEARRSEGQPTAALEATILMLAYQSGSELRPYHAEAGLHARATAAYWLAAGQYDAIRTRYTATA